MINSTVARRVPALAQLLLLELCHSLLELMEADLSEFRPVIAIWSDFFRLSGEFRKEELAPVFFFLNWHSHLNFLGTCSAAGPMAHTPQDCARLYAIMAGPDFQAGSDQSRIQPAVTIPKTLLKSIVGLKVGIDQSWNQTGVPDVLFRPFQKRLNWMIDQG